jgi:hypothetical protein
MSRREYEEWRDIHSWGPSRGGELEVQADLIPAAWLGSLLVPGSFEDRMTATQGFDGSARMFVSFVGADLREDGRVVGQEHITWTELARRNGRVPHALMEEETILCGPKGEDQKKTCYGALTPEQFDALLAILSRHTSSPSAWFLLWDGCGDLNEGAFNEELPKVKHRMQKLLSALWADPRLRRLPR